MTVQSSHDQSPQAVQESTLTLADYALSLRIALSMGAKWGHCYENAYPAFFAYPQRFEPNGLFVEGWIVFEDKDNVMCMEHGYLVSGERIIDPTIVLAVDPGVSVYYFSGVVRAQAELEALENEFFPHVRFSDFGDDGMGHPDYRAAYEAARAKASSLVTEGKTLVVVSAKALTPEEENAVKGEVSGVRIIVFEE